MERFQPKDRSMKVWRYLDLPKFISLLDTKKLHLSRADLLNDPHEGATLTHKKYCEEQSARLKKSFFISSWHTNEEESYAMWKLYAEKNQGVAIQTSYKKLTEAIAEPDIFIGLVKYQNYVAEPINENYECFMYKRLFFEYEREVRIIKQVDADNYQGQIPEGILVDVDLQKLIECVYVNPYTADWYYEVIKSIISKYYPPLIACLTWSSLRDDVEA